MYCLNSFHRYILVYIYIYIYIYTFNYYYKSLYHLLQQAHEFPKISGRTEEFFALGEVNGFKTVFLVKKLLE